MSSPKITRALISVSDKTGLSEFARGLVQCGVQLLSTGGTRRHLENDGIPVEDVSGYTGFPEVMDGRVKTLHPKIYGGILCRHDVPSDIETLDSHQITPLELVVVNLYPFSETISKEGVTDGEAIEQIDIGGPSMVRAAAKNHAFVTVATDPGQYEAILSSVRASGATTVEHRRQLAAAAFSHTAAYDRVIAEYFERTTPRGPEAAPDMPEQLAIELTRREILRYGENPHQRAALYRDPRESAPSVVSAEQLNGKELSYNNLLDLQSAMAIVRSLERPAVSVIKHNNPCGAATSDQLREATQKAMAGDPVSAFGSVLGINRPVDAATAEVLAEPGLFIEAIIAPDFEPTALEILTTKPKWKKNVRLMKVGELRMPTNRWLLTPLDGGMLLQEADILPDPEEAWECVTQTKPSEAQWRDLRFAWHMARFVKSNAITLCRDEMLVGVGAGQMSRVDSVEIAIKKSGDRLDGAALGSDAFFPFPDSVEHAAKAGIRAVIQPGGSRNDEAVIEACDREGVVMIFTGRRHFRH